MFIKYGSFQDFRMLITQDCCIVSEEKKWNLVYWSHLPLFSYPLNDLILKCGHHLLCNCIERNSQDFSPVVFLIRKSVIYFGANWGRIKCFWVNFFRVLSEPFLSANVLKRIGHAFYLYFFFFEKAYNTACALPAVRSVQQLGAASQRCW